MEVVGRIEWNGNLASPFEVPEGLTETTMVRVFDKNGNDPEVQEAGNFDWRHWENIPEDEQAFLAAFGISEKQDIGFYEVIE